MSANEIIRAWKDEEFLASLSGSHFAVPANPAGLAEAPAIEAEGALQYSLTCTKLECSNYIGCQ
jgi:mersacidin/lichenicidin family type 2 lantibiotic